MSNRIPGEVPLPGMPSDVATSGTDLDVWEETSSRWEMRAHTRDILAKSASLRVIAARDHVSDDTRSWAVGLAGDLEAAVAKQVARNGE